MANADDLKIGTQVMAPCGRTMHKALIVHPPEDHPVTTSTVYVQFEPPIKSHEPGVWTTHQACEPRQLDVGWSEPVPALSPHIAGDDAL